MRGSTSPLVCFSLTESVPITHRTSGDSDVCPLYLLVSTTCVAYSVASCSVTENPSAGRSKTGKQCLTLAEGNRCKCKLEGIDQPSLQILPHGGNTASDLDVLVTRCLFREPQRLFDSAADK